ncbi:Small-conductance mechanosensitive channel [Thermomonospora echinospora]|uniref:Small-conductance mechanosensitive channel n=1 Tax=Thermomonospora echinospora TaxID=1992 RepID=A0A1H6BWB5_9ACTN|nr:mechanosensitive ion channel domain-containing protein [Thermomonospora echinospora]SEG64745.1 Small-conductance mechanosensitive channel [Thermomonospora echinospora]
MSAFWAWTVFGVAVLVSVVVVEGIRRLLAGRLSARWPGAGEAARRVTAPAFAAAVMFSAQASLPAAEHLGGPGVDRVARHLLWIGGVATATWLLLRITYALTDPALDRLTRVEGERNRRARRARTQMLLLRRIAGAVVVIVAVGAVLFSFPAVRVMGAGVLASAGVAGLVVGIAARPVLGNLLAGLQLAFSDALRLDDVVVVDGEWGRIEELTLSYVVVRTWDERRLILPVSYFTEQPFENWTRQGSRVVGAVLFHVDWTVPVDDLRTELYRFLREHPLWDQRDWVLQVTEVLPNGLVQLRALMSAADAASAWDLRCDAREHIVDYLRQEHPRALPRLRTELPIGTGPA